MLSSKSCLVVPTLFNQPIETVSKAHDGGIKMPFHWTVTWTDGLSTIQLNEIQPNAPINAAKFSKPAAPTQANP